ncbi:MAG: class I SAM-dependent methyltransferase [Candidatus Andersenbacteria bacterium]|nr:class I SAM-dependent methyltransferase [bacterium]MDZ4225818.1 class I SAM-dependent methyltransferase [Candidatus Andersenbacteria bacterium]
MTKQTVKDRVDERVYITRDTCRLCGSRDLTRVWSFGPTPLANSYLTPAEVGGNEPFAPLDVYYCGGCCLLQLRDVVNPDALFKHYFYVSSTSPSFVKHFEDYARILVKRFKLSGNDLVVDVGSNDGVLLKPLQAARVRILGIDPAENVVAEANAAGIHTLPEYFTPEVARRVRAEHGPAKVITANNVFAHTDGIDTFVDAVKELLVPDGVYVFEAQYLGDLIANNLFDIVYHEHVNYYHVTPLVSYFESRDMEVFDVERVPVHGGSIRVYVQGNGGKQKKTEALAEVLRAEEEQGLNTIEPYRQFAKRIEENKKKLRQIIDDIKAQGKRIAGFGAPAKATTLMYAFGITGDDIDFIVDDAPLKQGRVMPGTHVPIVPAERLYEDKVDYCLILAWNFAAPIMAAHADFVKKGGRFIIPIPEPRVIK